MIKAGERGKCKNIDFMRFRVHAVVFSCILMLASVFGLATKGVNRGIDFSGGILIEIGVTGDNLKEFTDFLREEIAAEYHGASVQTNDDRVNAKRSVILRVQRENSADYRDDIARIKDIAQGCHLRASGGGVKKSSADVNGGAAVGEGAADVNANSGVAAGAHDTSTTNVGDAVNTKNAVQDQLIFEKVDYIGPKAGNEFVASAMKAMFLALIGIMAYVWIRFEWYYGIGVVLSLLHDAVVTVGFYVVTGYEFDLTSIAALLTVIGYSVNDSVVIYDRIRLNRQSYDKKNMIDIINLSLNETLSRTVMTVATTLIVACTLVVFGGSVLRGFSLAIFFGIAFGTYSSLFISTAILLYLNIDSPMFTSLKNKLKKLRKKRNKV